MTEFVKQNRNYSNSKFLQNHPVAIQPKRQPKHDKTT